MATTTTNFGWDIPQSTDLVKDGATAIAALGQDIDTAFVDFKGGTTGQVLKKTSATDLDVEWGTPSSGLTLINTTSFSAVASQSLPNSTFTTDYNNYLILLSGLISSVESIQIRLRASGSDNSTVNSYVIQRLNVSSTSVFSDRETNTLWSIGGWDSTLVNSLEIYLTNPFPATPTGINFRNIRSTSGAFAQFGAGTHNQTVSYDSATLFPAAGTITGTVSVYGYNK
jgi:hypothetical protein